MRHGLAIVGAVALGVAFSQFPEYAQQYLQRLGGAVDVLEEQVQTYRAAAAEQGISLEQYVDRFRANADVVVADDGAQKERIIARHEQLDAMLKRIQGANAFERFNLLPQFFDTEIGGRTLDNFKPAVPVTVEGFAYAGAGMLLGYGLVSMLIRLVTLPFYRRRRVYRPTS